MKFNFGEHIKTYREKSGLTQEELGGMVGVTGVAIMRYEKGLRQPKFDMVIKIADALGVDFSDMFDPSDARKLLEDLSKTYPDGSWKLTEEQRAKSRINDALPLLNLAGKQEAAKRVEELTEIPRYQAKKPAPAPPEGKDPTPAEPGPESPEKGG